MATQSGGTSRRAPTVLRPSDIAPHERGGGVKTIPLVTRAAGSASFLNGVTLFEPGASIPLHSHNCEESVMVLEGHAVAEIDGVDYEVGAGDVTFIPASLPHRFRNASDSEGMKIHWTYGSTQATRTLIASGETSRIDEERKAPPTAR